MTQIYTRQMEVAEASIKEYQKNANIVNTDMSQVRWFYVDGNGNAIVWANGQPVPVPAQSPMPPVFDKDSGQLISFWLDANGNITANVQQVTQWQQSDWKFDSDRWVYYRTAPNGNLEFAESPDSYQWPQFQPVTPEMEAKGQSFLAQYQDGQKWPRDWYCWQFVNDYLKSMWVSESNMFIDPIKDKAKLKNSDVPTIWSIAIMDSPTQPQYWHVAVVTAVNWNQMTIKESNVWWNWKVNTRTVPTSTAKYGFFDPKVAPKESPIYSRLNPVDKQFVDALVNYQVDLPWRASKNYKEIMAAASEKDPTFNSARFAERKKMQETWNTTTLKGWSLSKAATTMQLVAQLEDVYKWLKWQTRVQALNAFINEANRQIGDPNITSFDVARDLVVREMAGAFKGTASPTEQDVKDMSKILAGKLTPEQTQKAIDLAAGGIFKRINSEALSYQNVMWKKPASIFDWDTYNWMRSKWLPVDTYYASPTVFENWQTQWGTTGWTFNSYKPR
jgi:surface antigen